MEENLGKDYSIVKLTLKTKDLEVLYDCIPDLKQADLLAQLAMCNKQDDELIYIAAGWNRSIDTYHPKEYEEALKLAEEYKVTD